MRGRQLQSQELLLKGLRMVDSPSLADGLTHFELQHWGSNSKSTRDIQEGTELSSFTVRKLEGVDFSWREELAEAIVSWLSPPHPCIQMQAYAVSEYPPNWMSPFTCPTLMIP